MNAANGCISFFGVVLGLAIMLLAVRLHRQENEELQKVQQAQREAASCFYGYDHAEAYV